MLSPFLLVWWGTAMHVYDDQTSLVYEAQEHDFLSPAHPLYFQHKRTKHN